MDRIYLDANATTPLDPRVKEEMAPWLDCGNASSPHAEGRAARAAIDEARERVAALIGCAPREIVFTSGATEANALALLGSGASRVFASAIEHPSVLRLLEAGRPRVDLELGAVGPDGHLETGCSPAPDRELVSLMLANNETGAIQPVAEIAAMARESGAILHCDAVQAVGKIPVDVEALNVDLLTLSAHKMHGPKGAGALYVRAGARLGPLYHGGEHEHGLRAGTENVAAIVGLGAAAMHAAAERAERAKRWSVLKRQLTDRLASALPDARFRSIDPALANTVCVTVPGAEGEAVLLGLDLLGIAVATGSACSSGAAEPSHVLLAMGLSRREAEQTIRISFHAGTCEKEIDRLVTSLADVVSRLRDLER
jgi:cysteine desulfurase